MTKTETTDEIVIRRVRGSEIYQVIKLITEAFEREISITGLDVRRLWRMARFYRLLSYFYCFLDVLSIDFETILVAVTHGKVVGEIHAVPHGKRVWSLDSAAVDSRFRGRGIFKNLLKEALEYISERQGERVITSLWTTNIAPVKVTNRLKFEVFEEKALLYLEDINALHLKTKGNINIRNAERTDVKKIHEVRKALCPKQIEICKTAAENFSESIIQRLRNRITKVNSKKWIMELKGKVIGYAKVTYTSTEEAANIESFYVLPSEAFSEHIGILLNEVLAFLKLQNIRMVTASINNEWKEVIRRFESSGFRFIASIYEMVKVFPSDSYRGTEDS